MKVYYIDEQRRTRCFDADWSERNSVVAKHDYSPIKSNLSSYSSHFSRSRLHSTHCPVCSADVFFCECDNGGRVFFDTLAPTWKKHPCTTNYESSNRVKTYHLIHPKENHSIKKEGEKSSTKIVMEIPDFMTNFELSINKPTVYDNLVNNCTLMVRQQNGKLLLTIVVNNKKFKNEYLCNDKKFNNQRDLEIFIESVLWDTDLSVSMKINKKVNQWQRQKESKEKQFVPKRKGFTIVKKKNIHAVIPVVSAPKESSKISLDQFGSKKESLRAIREKIQKELDEGVNK